MDYYSILGVQKDASDKDLKTAYKKASMQHHPDRGGDENKFKEINEAYSTLKDPQKRGMYDHQQNGGGQGFNFNTQNMEDIFGAMFGQRRQQQRNPNRTIRVQYAINLSDTVTGIKDTIHYKLPTGENKSVNLTIPKGIVANQTVSYTGLGEHRHTQYPPGNLELLFRVKNDSKFIVSGIDLGLTIPVSVYDLITGTEKIIKTITGRKLNVKIKPNTSPNSILSIDNEGLSQFNINRRGKLYIDFKTYMPKLTDDQTLAIQKISNELNK